MESNKLPFGTQFSPEQIDLRWLLDIALEFDGKQNKELITAIAQKFFSEKATPEKLGENTCIAMKSYGLIAGRTTVQITDTGKKLQRIAADSQLYQAFAKHILLNLNGLVLIETLVSMDDSGDDLSNANINKALSQKGFDLKQTSNNVQVMKLWLAKADIVVGNWRVNEIALKALLNIECEEISLYKSLTPEQYYFLLALCNAATEKPLLATEVRSLATASYNIDFDEKTFANRIIKPLQDQDLIVATKTTGGRGAKPYMVELTNKSKREVVEPLLTQFRSQVGNALVDAYCKSFSVLQKEINSKDKHIKGLALEAFAIKIMRIIGLDFIKTRYRDIDTGGAEVDVLFDSTRLIYSRWQVQCKNTKAVTIDMVAKEVGLTHMLKSNAIVMMTTGHLTSDAKNYARRIMEDMNLCILTLEGEDIKSIIDNPTSIVSIFNQQAEKAKKIKVLHSKED